MRYENVAPGIYRDLTTGLLYERPTLDGKRTWRRLFARSIKLAKEEIATKRADRGRARLGLAVDPYAKPKATTVGEILEAYSKAGCPDRHGHPRPPKAKTAELTHCRRLAGFWQALRPADLTAKRFREYFEAIQRAKGRSGRRATDRELASLANACRFATDQGLLESNPFPASRQRFQIEAEVTHCRDCAPASTLELHRLAAMLFESRKSEVLGWQLLFEAFSGTRTNEALKLRRDAGPRQAGHRDGQWLWLQRSKRGVNPFALIHGALQLWLEAHARWIAQRFPTSPWYFPSPTNPTQPVGVGSLSHSLRRISALAAGGRRTSHGLRAFFVTVRRSQGVADGQIAAEIGDSSGAAIIASTYGAIPPNWQGKQELTWLPAEEPPAWQPLLDRLAGSPVDSPVGRLPAPSGDGSQIVTSPCIDAGFAPIAAG
jgi:integrase